MGNSNLSMGYPQRPGLVGARDLRAILALRREKEADNAYATYVRPLGDDQHLVKKECNDQPVRVGSLIPGATWSPGSTVVLMSNTGHKDDVIAGSPPLGKKGSSLVVSVPSLREVSVPVPAAPLAPPDLIGFFCTPGTGSGALAAYEYSGGTKGALIAQQTGLTFGTINDMVVVSYSPITVVIRDSNDDFLVWNIETNSLVTDTSHPATGFDLTSISHGGDGFAYFAETKTSVDKFRLFKIAPDGTISQVTGGSDTLPSTWNGQIYNFLYFDGNAGLLMMGGNPGDAGIIKIPSNGGQPFIVLDATYLPGDPAAGDWATYQAAGGGRMSAGGYALAINNQLDTIQGVNSTPSAVTVMEPYISDLTILCPSPDGTQFLVFQFDAASRVAVAMPGDAESGLTFYDAEDDPTYMSFRP